MKRFTIANSGMMPRIRRPDKEYKQQYKTQKTDAYGML